MTLRTEDLGFAYGDVPVLSDISFGANPGSVTAILGPNGSGKSTLLRCLNAVLRPAHGRVLLDEVELHTLTARQVARRVGYVAQRNEPAHVTAYDAVLLGRTPHLGFRVSRRDLEITQAVIESMGLEELGVRYIDRMSGGEVQKVSIARALAQEPDILLLDEPTASLDLKNQYEILEIIRHLADHHGVTVILTMHDLNSVFRYADRVLFLRNHRIYTDCTPGEVTAEVVRKVYGVEVKILYHADVPVVVPTGGIPDNVGRKDNNGGLNNTAFRDGVTCAEDTEVTGS
jgi:iron complex transport system ATP-binding protein